MNESGGSKKKIQRCSQKINVVVSRVEDIKSKWRTLNDRKSMRGSGFSSGRHHSDEALHHVDKGTYTKKEREKEKERLSWTMCERSGMSWRSVVENIISRLINRALIWHINELKSTSLCRSKFDFFSQIFVKIIIHIYMYVVGCKTVLGQDQGSKIYNLRHNICARWIAERYRFL